MDRVTVREAADRLGVTPDAIRQRIKRETIPHDKGENGLTYVYISPNATVTDTSADAKDESVTKALLRSYEDQIEFLRRELERKDTLLMSLVSKVPQLEAPSKPSEASVKPTEGSEKDTATEEERPPWWRFWS